MRTIIELEKDDFLFAVEWCSKHASEIRLKLDFERDYLPYKNEFDHLFEERYPNKAPDDISYEDLDEETAKAFAMYKYVYWRTLFEKACDSFDLSFVYFLYPTKDYNIQWLIESLSTPIEGNEDYIEIGFEGEMLPEKYTALWDTWNAGRELDEFYMYDNEFDHTYAYYSPVFVHGKKIGLIGTEVDVDKADLETVKQVYVQMRWLALIMVVMFAALLLWINRRYLKKLFELRLEVADYAKTRDPSVAGCIHRRMKGVDEVVLLGCQIADMILEIDDYIKKP